MKNIKELMINQLSNNHFEDLLELRDEFNSDFTKIEYKKLSKVIALNIEINKLNKESYNLLKSVDLLIECGRYADNKIKSKIK